jgi:hypothetical protein
MIVAVGVGVGVGVAAAHPPGITLPLPPGVPDPPTVTEESALIVMLMAPLPS